jgi:hypothetical protein
VFAYNRRAFVCTITDTDTRQALVPFVLLPMLFIIIRIVLSRVLMLRLPLAISTSLILLLLLLELFVFSSSSRYLLFVFFYVLRLLLFLLCLLKSRAVKGRGPSPATGLVSIFHARAWWTERLREAFRKTTPPPVYY